METLIGTTICAIRKNGEVAIAGDGQVTFGDKSIFKGTAKKIRKIYHDKVLIGFAGVVVDALILAENLENLLEKCNGNLQRSVVELVKCLRKKETLKLEAFIIVADLAKTFIVSGNGEIIEPEGDVCAIGSGGNYALAAARALAQETELKAREIALKSLEIASEICIYTNKNLICEILTNEGTC